MFRKGGKVSAGFANCEIGGVFRVLGCWRRRIWEMSCVEAVNYGHPLNHKHVKFSFVSVSS